MFDIAIIKLINNDKVINELLNRFPFAKVFEKQDNQLNLIKDIVNWARTEYVWILSDINDYTYFDLYFIPVPDQKYQVHAWPNDDYNYHTFLVPVNYFKNQFTIQDLNQYKHVNWHDTFIHKDTNVKNNLEPLDIFYVSNGEPYAKINYQCASSIINRPITWIKNINSRTKALQYAAELSLTEWFFVIPAKLQITKDFNWDWHPILYPMLQYYKHPKDLKHFVFTAKNPLNKLEYGHMALVAYNKSLVLDTNDPGLDFTLSKPYESIPTNSGIANFNLDPLTTWRTAFREVINLSYYNKTLPDKCTQERLETWISKADGLNAEWCLLGAKDAIEYFNSVHGDYASILKSYNWQWTDNYAKQKGYKLWN